MTSFTKEEFWKSYATKDREWRAERAKMPMVEKMRLLDALKERSVLLRRFCQPVSSPA